MDARTKVSSGSRYLILMKSYLSDSQANEVASTSSTFCRVAPGGVNDVTQGSHREALGRLTDDHVALEQRVTVVDSALRVSNRLIGELEGQLQGTKAEITSITTAHAQDRGAYHHQLQTLEGKVDQQQESIRINNVLIETVSQRVNSLEAHHNTRLSAIEGQRPTTQSPSTAVIAPEVPGVTDIIGEIQRMLLDHRAGVKADIAAAIGGLEGKIDRLFTAAIGHPTAGTRALDPLPTGVHHPTSGVVYQQTTRPPLPIVSTDAENGRGHSASTPVQGLPMRADPESHHSARTVPGDFWNMPAPPSRPPRSHDLSASARSGMHSAAGLSNTSQSGNQQVHQGGGLASAMYTKPPAPAHPNSVPYPQKPLPQPASTPYLPGSHPQDIHAPSMFTPNPQSLGVVVPSGSVGQTTGPMDDQGGASKSMYARPLSTTNQQYRPSSGPQASAPASSHLYGGSTHAQGPQPESNRSYPPPMVDQDSNGGGEGAGEEGGGIPIDNEYAEFGGIPPGGMAAYLQAPLPEKATSVSQRAGTRTRRRKEEGSMTLGGASNLSFASAASQASNRANFASAAPHPSAITSVGGISLGWSHPGSPFTDVPSTTMGSAGPSNTSNK